MGDISKDIHSKFANNKIKALLNILYTANWISSYQNDFFKAYGISPQQYNILRILKGAGEPLNVQIVKDRMIERSPNTTRLMDKLCAKKYIERLACPEDRRAVKVAITQEGKNLLESIPANLDNKLLKNLNEEEAEQLSNLLDKMR
ncbi:MAG: MarR family winged helix-turn-helix transcriptional regulator [Flavobacteriales bacterium]